MNRTVFNEIVEKQIEHIRTTLIQKNKEYADTDNVHRNFIAAARKLGITPQKALQGMLIKHIVSVDDIIDGKTTYNNAMLDEKIGDIINYYVLLKALLITHEGVAGPQGFTGGTGVTGKCYHPLSPKYLGAPGEEVVEESIAELKKR